jgi:hypothetical protein
VTPSPETKSLVIKRNLQFCFQKIMSHLLTIFCPKNNCMQEAQLFSPPLYCIAFAQLYSCKFFEFEFFNVIGQWNVVITNQRKYCVQFITFQNPAHKALTLPWKCNPKFPCSSPIGYCHDVNEDCFNIKFSNSQPQHNWISTCSANNITIGFSKKYPSGFLQLAMGKIQTLVAHNIFSSRNLFGKTKTSNLGGWMQETKTFTYEMTHFWALDNNLL